MKTVDVSALLTWLTVLWSWEERRRRAANRCVTWELPVPHIRKAHHIGIWFPFLLLQVLDHKVQGIF